jgi:8-oxo-dGTP diphosphatase
MQRNNTMVTKAHPMPFTRVELCVLGMADGRLSVLLARRQEAPAKGHWALPGGVLRIDLDADLESAAQRVAAERLGTPLPYLRQQLAVGGKARDPRAPWSLSIVYRALVHVDQLEVHPGKRVEALRWQDVDIAAADETLALDHEKIIASAVAELRAEVERLDIPFAVLPPTFTLGELQQYCENMLGRKLDKSSFRRRLDDRTCVEPIPDEYRGGANRPAQVYRACGR